ncbi:dTMP kinase [Cohnella massiliensis]|uniref:dTMP kinase n=1 Tax=Cohnella massiliensis TaxID=1816691 RepID=UPI0009B9E54B|nr:dTMP kinase [Cohnella massiliensis]
MSKGKFITIEGGEGSGKTTLIGRLADRIKEKGYEAVTTREPGGSPIAEAIRNVILERSHTKMDGRTEALLYAASRRQHLVEIVVPAIERGAVVLCDRFIDSSLAYQGHARGLGMEAVWEINRFAVDDCMPDLTLFLDLEPEAGLARIEANALREVNRLDLEGLAFHRKVREGYLEVAGRFPERIVTIDAMRSPEFVLEDAWRYLEARLG